MTDRNLKFSLAALMHLRKNFEKIQQNGKFSDCRPGPPNLEFYLGRAFWGSLNIHNRNLGQFTNYMIAMNFYAITPLVFHRFQNWDRQLIVSNPYACPQKQKSKI